MFLGDNGPQDEVSDEMVCETAGVHGVQKPANGAVARLSGRGSSIANEALLNGRHTGPNAQADVNEKPVSGFLGVRPYEFLPV